MAVAPIGDKSTIEALAAKMNNPDCLNDFVSCKSVLSKVTSLMSNNADLSPLLPSAVKLLAHSDMCIKKVAGYILCQFGSKDPGMVLLAINTLLKDCQESNPMVRGIAIRTLCSLRDESVLEHADRALQRAISDKSAYVRRAAVLGCVKVYHFNKSYIRESNIIDKLYSMIRDSDPIVVVNCLSALDEILHEEGGIVMNKNIAHHLLNKLNDMPTGCQIRVLTMLKKYTPGSEDEIFDIMNVLDPFLKHSSCTASVIGLELFLHIVQSMPELQTEVCRRGQEAMLTQLGSGNVELIFTVLDFLATLSKPNLQVFSQGYQSFFCRHKDPNYLKTKKMKLLPLLLNDSNEQAILDELFLYCQDLSRDVSLYAVESVANISISNPHLQQDCLDKFKSLLESSSCHVLCNVLQVMQKVSLEDRSLIKDLMSTLGHIHGTIMEDEAGSTALLHLLGEYGEDVEDVAYVLEEFVDRLEEVHQTDLKLQLLTTALKVFFVRPGETQTLLGGLLETYMSDPSRSVRDQAHFYYGLLELDVHYAKSVICGEGLGWAAL